MDYYSIFTLFVALYAIYMSMLNLYNELPYFERLKDQNFVKILILLSVAILIGGATLWIVVLFKKIFGHG